MRFVFDLIYQSNASSNKIFKIIFDNFDDVVHIVTKFKFSRICHLTQFHVIVLKKIYVKKSIYEIQFKFSKYSFDFVIYVRFVLL